MLGLSVEQVEELAAFIQERMDAQEHLDSLNGLWELRAVKLKLLKLAEMEGSREP